MMEGSTWTNERLDDLATGMREGFARVDGDVRDVRGEIGALRAEMNDGFKQLRGEIAALRGEINDLRQMVFRTNVAMMLGLLGVIAAILARGA